MLGPVGHPLQAGRVGMEPGAFDRCFFFDDGRQLATAVSQTAQMDVQTRRECRIDIHYIISSALFLIPRNPRASRRNLGGSTGASRLNRLEVETLRVGRAFWESFCSGCDDTGKRRSYLETDPKAFDIQKSTS